MAFIVQDYIDIALAEHDAEKDAIIADLEAQLANAEINPVPDASNTGFRGGTANGPTITTLSNTEVVSKSWSTTAGLTHTGTNLKIRNGRIIYSGAVGLNTEGSTGFEMKDTSVQGVSLGVKGKGTFDRCNINKLELTGPSIVKNCYIPGGIVGSSFLAEGSGNNTVA